MHHLSATEQTQLLNLLTKFHDLFDGTLGKWTGEPYDIELQPDAKPYHSWAYPIPKIHEETLKKEVHRLVVIGTHICPKAVLWYIIFLIPVLILNDNNPYSSPKMFHTGNLLV